MPLEIERKFLVDGDGWRAGVTRARHLRQAYLTKNRRISIRVRIDGETHASLTIKSAGAGIERHEYEYVIPVADALDLLEQREGSVIVKTRHIVPFGGLEWEIDVFEGDNAGLIVAEVELADAGHRIVRPAWLGREITDDRRYYNADLSKHPFTRWSEPVASGEALLAATRAVVR